LSEIQSSVIKELRQLMSVMFPFRKIPQGGQQQKNRVNEYLPPSMWNQPPQQQNPVYPSMPGNGPNSKIKEPPIPFNPIAQQQQPANKQPFQKK
jgi:hypothetical protein